MSSFPFQDEKHLPMLTTGYAKNVFVLTDAVLKTDDTEMQKKLAYDVLQSYRSCQKIHLIFGPELS